MSRCLRAPITQKYNKGSALIGQAKLFDELAIFLPLKATLANVTRSEVAVISMFMIDAINFVRTSSHPVFPQAEYIIQLDGW
jgi:hypothetical protein